MSVREQWPALDAAGDWEPGLAPAELRALFADLPEVPELGELYALMGGGSLTGVEVFSADEFSDVNRRQSYRRLLPNAVFFASDGGDKFFFVDQSGALGRGAGAVFAMSRGGARRAECVFAARGLEQFLQALEGGERPWLGRLTLGALEADELLELVAASGYKIEGRPYLVSSNALREAVKRCGVQIPSTLAQLLREVDGMRIPAARVTIWAAERLEAIPEIRAQSAPYPALIWFANDDDGARYAITTSEWHGLDVESVLRIAPEIDPTVAPAIGRLAQVVTGWLKD